MAATQWTRRYVIRDENPEASVGDLAARLGWEHAETTEPAPSKGIPYSVKWRISEEVSCLYVEDDLSEMACVLFGGPDGTALRDVLEQIGGQLKIWPPEKLVETDSEIRATVGTILESMDELGIGG
jgi:hypothetical protein